MSNRVLFVEDEATLAEIVKEVLEGKGFQVSHADCLTEAIKLVQKNQYDILVLDVMLPDGNGFNLLKQIRRMGIQTPALFLTSKSMTSDLVEGFESGANDYIKKPFSMDELYVRMKALLGMFHQAPTEEIKTPQELQIGEYRFHYPQGLLTIKGTNRKLTFREAEILYYLISKKTQIISRKELLLKFWDNDDYFSGRSLDVFITKLRKYLDKDPTVAIMNFRGQGYKLIC